MSCKEIGRRRKITSLFDNGCSHCCNCDYCDECYHAKCHSLFCSSNQKCTCSVNGLDPPVIPGPIGPRGPTGSPPVLKVQEEPQVRRIQQIERRKLRPIIHPGYLILNGLIILPQHVILHSIKRQRITSSGLMPMMLC